MCKILREGKSSSLIVLIALSLLWSSMLDTDLEWLKWLAALLLRLSSGRWGCNNILELVAWGLDKTSRGDLEEASGAAVGSNMDAERRWIGGYLCSFLDDLGVPRKALSAIEYDFWWYEEELCSFRFALATTGEIIFTCLDEAADAAAAADGVSEAKGVVMVALRLDSRSGLTLANCISMLGGDA